MSEAAKAGRGKKQCGNENCLKFVGVRTQKCECGFEFAVKNKATETVADSTADSTASQPTSEEAQARFSGITVIAIPGGGPLGQRPICPIKLKSNSPDDVADWIVESQAYAEKRRERYALTAFLYMASIIHDRGTKEFDTLCDEIRCQFVQF